MELRIEKWIYGGEGLARMAPDEAGRGKAVFVPFVLPGETVEAEFTEERSGFARAGPIIKDEGPDFNAAGLRLVPGFPFVYP